MNPSRIARVAAGMLGQGLEQILVSSIESIYYLSGIWCPMGERLQALLIDASGEVTLIANRMFALTGRQGAAKIVEYDDVDDSVAVLASLIKPGKLGVDKTWPSHFLIRLLALRPDVMPVVGSRPVDEARMIKDAQEIEAMIKSSQLNDAAVRELSGTLALGDSEQEVGRRYTDLARATGATGDGFALVCFGENTAEPHHVTDNTQLKQGEAVILDVGCQWRHAMSDMTRTVFFGSATDEQKRVYDTVLRANLAAIDKVRPGVALKDVDRAARKLIEDAGHGPNFLHRTGHGIGIEGHEPPDVSAVSDVICKPGMTFSIEPGIYLPGKFGVRIEDLVLVTEDGCLVLNALEKDLLIVK